MDSIFVSNSLIFAIASLTFGKRAFSSETINGLTSARSFNSTIKDPAFAKNAFTLFPIINPYPDKMPLMWLIFRLFLFGASFSSFAAAPGHGSLRI